MNDDDMSRFTLTINLGNDAMQTPQDVAEALGNIAKKLRQDANNFGDSFSSVAGSIFDTNGNRVGKWNFQ